MLIEIIVVLCMVLLIGITVYFWVSMIKDIIQWRKNKKAPPQEEDESLHFSTCYKCNTLICWKEKDAIVKYAPGKGYKVPCPHCNELLHLYDE